MNLLNIPEELKSCRSWVCWKEIQGRKIPVDPASGLFAKSNDSSTWRKYSEALVKLKHYDGLGFMFSSPYVGIDMDDCVVDGRLDEFSSRIVSEVGSYTELSPSGTGVHIICKSDINKAYKNRNIEIYGSRRFFTFTGDICTTSTDCISNVDLTNIINREFEIQTSTKQDEQCARHGKRKLRRLDNLIANELSLLEPGNIHNVTCRVIGILHSSGHEKEFIRSVITPKLKDIGADLIAFEKRLEDITRYARH